MVHDEGENNLPIQKKQKENPKDEEGESSSDSDGQILFGDQEYND